MLIKGKTAVAAFPIRILFLLSFSLIFLMFLHPFFMYGHVIFVIIFIQGHNFDHLICQCTTYYKVIIKMLVCPSVNSAKNLKEPQKSSKEALNEDAISWMTVIVIPIIVVLGILDRADTADIRRGSRRTNIPFITEKGPVTRWISRQGKTFFWLLQEVRQVSFISTLKQLKIVDRCRDMAWDVCAEVGCLSTDGNFCQTIFEIRLSSELVWFCQCYPQHGLQRYHQGRWRVSSNPSPFLPSLNSRLTCPAGCFADVLQIAVLWRSRGEWIDRCCGPLQQ